MKKNLLTFLFVVVFLCGSALVVSAKNDSSTENPVAVSKSAKSISNKIKSLKAICMVTACGNELQVLLGLNALYEQRCAPGGYLASCESTLAGALISAGNLYEDCLLNPYIAKNIDRTIDRNEREKSRDVKSR